LRPVLIRFSSLYIGILAATHQVLGAFIDAYVSVPFTSGSSLQPGSGGDSGSNSHVSVPFTSGSSLQLGAWFGFTTIELCFSSLYIGILAATRQAILPVNVNIFVSVPFTSGSSLQRRRRAGSSYEAGVSVPFTSGSSLQHQPQDYFLNPQSVSVPFTSGSSLQH